MVKRKADSHSMTPGRDTRVFHVTFRYCAYAQNRHLWHVNDRREGIDFVRSEVTDREGPPAQVRGGQSVDPGKAAEASNFCRELS